MKITDALRQLAYAAHANRLPLPIITMPARSLLDLSFLIERELGGNIYITAREPTYEFQFCGIKFEAIGPVLHNNDFADYTASG